MKLYRISIPVLFTLLLSFALAACAAQQQPSGGSPSVQATSPSGSAEGGKTEQKEAKASSKYPEKDIEFVVGYKPGGGYSDWALAIAPFIEKHLPNKVNVKVRHMDGAGGVAAANYIQKAKPDGYTMIIYNSGLIFSQLATDVEYDLNKITWLARLTKDSQIAAVSAKGPYNSIEDFKKQTKPAYILSSRGLAVNATINGAITFAKQGVKWKPLNHGGTGESVLSVIRGDADITWGAYESLQQYVSNGDLKPIIYYGTKKHPNHPDVPIPSDIGMPDLNEATNTHRLVGAPPQLPDDARAILESAIKKAVDDPEFQKVLDKMKLSTDYLSGKDTEELVRQSFKDFELYKPIVKELFEQDKK